MRPNGRLGPVTWAVGGGERQRKCDQTGGHIGHRRNDLPIRAGRIIPKEMSLTVKQITNLDGFPKAAELIEITGAHALEASDRAIFNQLLQIAHDSEKLTEPDAEWEITRLSPPRLVQTREQRPHPGKPSTASAHGGQGKLHLGSQWQATHPRNAFAVVHGHG